MPCMNIPRVNERIVRGKTSGSTDIIETRPSELVVPVRPMAPSTLTLDFLEKSKPCIKLETSDAATKATTAKIATDGTVR